MQHRGRFRLRGRPLARLADADERVISEHGGVGSPVAMMLALDCTSAWCRRCFGGRFRSQREIGGGRWWWQWRGLLEVFVDGRGAVVEVVHFKVRLAAHDAVGVAFRNFVDAVERHLQVGGAEDGSVADGGFGELVGWFGEVVHVIFALWEMKKKKKKKEKKEKKMKGMKGMKEKAGGGRSGWVGI